jgi:hypothetical protein
MGNSSISRGSDAWSTVLAYAGNSTAGQWFIPSMNELNELCKYARGQQTGNPIVQCGGFGVLKSGRANDQGGFVNRFYFSSSENNSNRAWALSLGDGSQSVTSKNGSAFAIFVRPVRAF